MPVRRMRTAAHSRPAAGSALRDRDASRPQLRRPAHRGAAVPDLADELAGRLRARGEAALEQRAVALVAEAAVAADLRTEDQDRVERVGDRRAVRARERLGEAQAEELRALGELRDLEEHALALVIAGLRLCGLGAGGDGEGGGDGERR